jgi:hypothetical protein
VDLQAVGQELYGLSPAEFTAARDTKAAEARRSGDRDLAAAIKQLKRPGQAAWLANVLARHRPHRVDELLALGDRLRDSQRRLAGEEMKELARQGRRVVGELVDEAERLASPAGQRPSPSARRQLQETLEAALADPEAGRQVRAGQLAAPLSYAGLGSVGDDGQTAAATAGREGLEAQRASAELHAAERRVAELTAELQSAHRLRDRVREQVEELERQLHQVGSQESEVAQHVEEIEAAIAVANRKVEETRRRLGR